MKRRIVSIILIITLLTVPCLNLYAANALKDIVYNTETKGRTSLNVDFEINWSGSDSLKTKSGKLDISRSTSSSPFFKDGKDVRANLFNHSGQVEWEDLAYANLNMTFFDGYFGLQVMAKNNAKVLIFDSSVKYFKTIEKVDIGDNVERDIKGPHLQLYMISLLLDNFVAESSGGYVIDGSSMSSMNMVSERKVMYREDTDGYYHAGKVDNTYEFKYHSVSSILEDSVFSKSFFEDNIARLYDTNKDPKKTYANASGKEFLANYQNNGLGTLLNKIVALCGYARDKSSNKQKYDDALKRWQSLIDKCNSYAQDVADTNKNEDQKDEAVDLEVVTGAADATLENWSDAMFLINMGDEGAGKYDKSYLNINNLTSNTKLSALEKFQVSVAPFVWNDLSESRPYYELNYDMNKVPDLLKEVDNSKLNIVSDVMATRDNSLTSIINTVSNGIGVTDLNMMLTFHSRIQYYSSLCQISSDISFNDAVEAFYTIPRSHYLSKQLVLIDIGPNSASSGQFQIYHANAYKRFLETCNEIAYYQKTGAALIQKAETEDEKMKYARCLISIYKGIEYLDSTALRAFWTTPYDDKTKSLEELYNQLQMYINKVNDLDTITSDNIKLETGQPLNQFFSIEGDATLAPAVLKGISYSTAFIPMKTNVYDPYVIARWEGDDNDKFLEEFHYLYGFNRKALYIDSSADAAEELYTTGNKGKTRVCTLKDLINPHGDIVLYIDPNFYNVNDLADIIDKSYDKITNTEKGDTEDDRTWWESITNAVGDVIDLDIESQVKTAGKTQYSQKLRNRLRNRKDSEYVPGARVKDSSNSDEEKDDRSDDNKDNIVLTSGQINEYLSMRSYREVGENGEAMYVYEDYNVLQAYAVVSSVYRCNTLFNLANSPEMSNPVFIASDTVPLAVNATQTDKNQIFNWMLLKNLKSQIPVGYSSSTDMDSPVYMDIYGNILTESGVVVVPAAANATLFGDAYHSNIYNMALPYVYGGDYELKGEDVNINVRDTLDGPFYYNSDTKSYKVNSRVIYADNTTLVDFARLSIADEDTVKAIQVMFENYLISGDYKVNTFINIILEVMRGAPIEYIDKDFENLNTSHTLSRAGLAAAAKLEVLGDALDTAGKSTMVAIPNIAFMDGIEYVVMIAYKAAMFIAVLVLMFTLFRDMMGLTFSFKTIFKCLMGVILTVASIITVPMLFDLSYYQSNKMLLQDEIEYIAMLNEEKRQNGVEIGVTEIKEPDTSSQFLLKLDDITIPWYELFSKVLLTSSVQSLREIFEEYEKTTPLVNRDDVVIMNDGVYVPVDNLFDSTRININTETHKLTLYIDEGTTASFYTPYYVILEALVTKVNAFNTANDWKSYTTTLQKGGRLKSIGLAEPYLTSKLFMESDTDVFNFYEVYQLMEEVEQNDIWNTEEIGLMSHCGWYNQIVSVSDLKQRIALISDEAKKFVAENKELLGRVSDETFLKSMALHIALYHNKILGVQNCNAIEIVNMSQDDINRLIVGDTEEAMANSTLTYPRYVYQIGGTIAVLLAAVLDCVNFVVGYIKPLCTIIIFVMFYISLFVFKVVLRKKSSSGLGYIMTVVALCGCNVLHAILLSLSMKAADVGLNPSLCIIISILVQIIYTFYLLKVVTAILKDWKDLGAANYQFGLSKANFGMNEMLNRIKHGFRGRKYYPKGESPVSRRRNKQNYWEDYQNMSDRRERRKKKYGIG